MCLAIPSKIVGIENDIGILEVDGVRRKASLLFLENPKIGEYVIVHAGFAINKIDESVAMETLKLLREAASMADQRD